jgi:hypothetical protein
MMSSRTHALVAGERDLTSVSNHRCRKWDKFNVHCPERPTVGRAALQGRAFPNHPVIPTAADHRTAMICGVAGPCVSSHERTPEIECPSTAIKTRADGNGANSSCNPTLSQRARQGRGNRMGCEREAGPTPSSGMMIIGSRWKSIALARLQKS